MNASAKQGWLCILQLWMLDEMRAVLLKAKCGVKATLWRMGVEKVELLLRRRHAMAKAIDMGWVPQLACSPAQALRTMVAVKVSVMQKYVSLECGQLAVSHWWCIGDMCKDGSSPLAGGQPVVGLPCSISCSGCGANGVSC